MAGAQREASGRVGDEGGRWGGVVWVVVWNWGLL